MQISAIKLKAISLIFFAIIFAGCRNNLQNKLANRINQDCVNQHSCKIKLSDVTKFKWDKMYIFGSWTTSDSIAKTIGFKYSDDDIGDDTQRLLFTDNKRIVYQEDIDYLNGDKEILFDDTNDSLFQSKRYYSPSEALFSVARDKSKESSEFYLTRIKTNYRTQPK